MVYENDGRERLFSGHTGRIFVLLTVIWFSLSLASRLLPPLLPAIIDDLAISTFLAGVALTVERVVRAAAEYPAGRFADGLSRTTVLLGCLAFGVAGVTVLGLAITYQLLLLGVALFGVGYGMYSPATRALLSDVFYEKRGRAFGISMVGSEVSGVVGAGVAIVIVSYATWRAAFLPLALLLAGLLVALYSVSREPVRIEPVGLGVRETGGRIFRDPSLRWILVVYSLFVLAGNGVATFLPLFLIEIHGVSFAIASSAFAILYAVGIVVKPASGYLSDVASRLHISGGSMAVAAVGLAVLIAAPLESVAIAGVVVYALGYRGLPPALQAHLMDRFDDENMAGDLGAMRTVYMGVGSLGPAYAGFASNELGFVATFVSFAGFYLAGAAILAWIALRPDPGDGDRSGPGLW